MTQYLIGAKLLIDEVNDGLKKVREIGSDILDIKKDVEYVAQRAIPYTEDVITIGENIAFKPLKILSSAIRGTSRGNILDINNLNFDRDDVEDSKGIQILKQSIPQYGNWCGPGWSQGMNGLKESEIDWTFSAIDEIDLICKAHDYQYGFVNIPGAQIIADKIVLDKVNKLQKRKPEYITNPYLIALINAFTLKINLETTLYGDPDSRLYDILENKTRDYFESINTDFYE